MTPLELDREDSSKVFEQVAAAIRRAIADGEASPGERLPPARDLAAELGVNSNTVLRALRLLRDEGLLEFRRGRGVTVAGTPGAHRRPREGTRARRALAHARLPARGGRPADREPAVSTSVHGGGTMNVNHHGKIDLVGQFSRHST